MSTRADEVVRGIISRLPLGLLGFLQVKNGGEYPRSLAPVLSPTWDLLELLHGSQPEYLFSGPVVAGPAGTATSALFTVPQNEVWYVRVLGAKIITAAGEALAGSLAISQPQGGNNVIPLSNQLTAAASQSVLQVMTTGAFFANPGSLLVFWTNTITGAPTVELVARMSRLPV